MPLPERNDATEGRDRRREARPGAAPDAGPLIVAPAASSFVTEARHQAADPVIARFRDALQRIQSTELERLYDRLPELSEHSRQAIGQFADSLVAKVLHPPLESLRDESRSGSPHRLLDALERLFRLRD